MKRKSFSIPFILLLTSCGSAQYVKGPRYTVSLLSNEHVSILSDAVLHLDRGENASFDIRIDDDYFLSSVSHGYYDEDDNKIIVDNVTASMSIQMTLNYKDGKNIIVYDYNGSTAANKTEKITYVQYDTTYHKRVNTLTGMDVNTRFGYTLVGWNTRRDGTGEEIGLGSRISVKEEEHINLYAQWRKWDDASDYEYDVNEGKAFITKYTGNKDTVVIPGIIDNNLVIEVMTDSFINCDSIKEIVFPAGVGMIQKNSFQNCPNLSTLYFYDTLRKIYPTSFTDCPNLSTVHINANMKPKYADRWTSNWADKFDRLVLGKEARVKQMAFFSGSSMSNGLWSPDIDAAFNYEYKITDLGVSYLINSQMQFEIMENLLDENDILIHAPEDLSDVTVEKMAKYNDLTWRCLEQNYDLLTLTDIRNSNDFFKSYSEYNYDRSFEKDTEYTDHTDDFNEYGDLKEERGNGADEDKGYDVYFDPDKLQDDVISELNTRYEKMKEDSITVYLSYGPANLTANEIAPEEKRLVYEQKIKDGITAIPIISKLSDYLYTGNYFSNTNYHLTLPGAKMRTKQLISDIKTQMIKEGKWIE